MVEPDIRPARADELAAVVEVVTQAYQSWADRLGFRPGPMNADYAALVDAGRVYVTGEQGVDAILVLSDEDDCLLVENVAVRPDRQGRGIGRKLLDFAEREAVRRGRPAVRLYTHELMDSNVALYRALGYVETGREPVEAGHLVHLRKAITVG